MTKKYFLKLATAALVFLFAANVVNAQVVEGANYVEATETTYQTVGITLGFYALPDAFYSPDYNEGSGWLLNPASAWAWQLDGASVAASGPPNYVEFTPTAVGALTLSVSETNSTLNCDGAEVSHTIEVVQVPSASITGSNDSDVWDVLGANEYTLCGDNLSDIISIGFAEGTVPVGYQNYTYSVSVVREGFDINDNSVVALEDVSGTLGRAAGFDAMVAGQTTTFTVSGMTILDNVDGDPVRTRYQVTIDEVASTISRLSEFRGGGTPGTFTNNTETITYWLTPAPVTGPIYHIPNNHTL